MLSQVDRRKNDLILGVKYLLIRIFLLLQIIIFLTDHQVSGGYPKFFSVYNLEEKRNEGLSASEGENQVTFCV